jgi:NTE family protein
MTDTDTDDRPLVSRLFPGVDPAALQAWMSAGESVALSAGQTLFREGDDGDAVFVVLEGALEARIGTAAGPRPLQQFDPGELLGEMSILTRRPRAATVVALGPSRLLRVAADRCRDLLAAHPSLRERLVELAAQRRPSLHLRSVAVFQGLDEESFARLDERGRWLRLRAGEVLFRQGETADALYVLVHGSLEVLVAGDEGGEPRPVDVLGRGASIGEIALLVRGTRSATVRALRDSEVLRLDTEEFDHLLHRRPTFAVALARTLATRLRDTTREPRRARRRRAIALVPCAPGGLPPELGTRLTAAFSAAGLRALLITSRLVEERLGDGLGQAGPDHPGASRLLDWLHRAEQEHDYLLYECDAALTPWTRRALRQADVLLLVGRAGDDPAPGPVEEFAASDPTVGRLRRELVLVQRPGTPRPSGTADWLRGRSVAARHHVALETPATVARLVRFVSGRALSVAMSGGGARAFAHIGALRALAEAGLEIDLVGGTSMGAIIAAEHALGLTPAEMTELNRRRFTQAAVVRDFTVPVVSLMKGRSTVAMLRAMFGEARIEDLWTRYFCVSCNLSRAEVVVHEEGPLWLWTRASSSVPGIGPPVPWQGELLVDGGLLNNLPVDVARRLGGGPAIALDASATVDLRTDLETRPEMSGWPHLVRALDPRARGRRFPNIMEILSRAATLSSEHGEERARRDADLYLRPPTDEVDALNWAGIADVVEIGYRHAARAIDHWLGHGGRERLARGGAAAEAGAGFEEASRGEA